jgi:hypothetical protein
MNEFEKWWAEFSKTELDKLPLDPMQSLKAVAQLAWNQGGVEAWKQTMQQLTTMRWRL